MNPAKEPPPTKREQRKFWVVEDFTVRHLKGYSCSPDNKGFWWIPEAGFSACLGEWLFETEQEALLKMLSKLARKSADNAIAIKSISTRLSKL